jgi:hypothetical protein
MSESSSSSVYYLPGAGGQVAARLGEAILDRGYKLVGRETRGNFSALSFQEKLDLIAEDLPGHFWSTDAKVIVNS